MLRLRDSVRKLPAWSLVYLATISTSCPRSRGICTFTRAAPSASLGVGAAVQRGTTSTHPRSFLSHCCPYCAGSCGSQRENPAASPWGRLGPVPQPHAGPPRTLGRVPKPVAWGLLRDSAGQESCPCAAGGFCKRGLYPSLPWCWGGGREKTSPRRLPPGPAGGGAETARRASS